MEIKYTYDVDKALPCPLDFNHDEVNNEVSAMLNQCDCLVTEYNVKEKKGLRAAINKIIKALKDEKTRLRKKFLSPIDECVKKIDEVVAKCESISSVIDIGVKRIEDEARDKKLSKLRQYMMDKVRKVFANYYIISSKGWDEWLFGQKFENATFSYDRALEEIDRYVNQVCSDMELISKLYKDGRFKTAVLSFINNGFSHVVAHDDVERTDKCDNLEHGFYECDIHLRLGAENMRELRSWLNNAYIPHVVTSIKRSE